MKIVNEIEQMHKRVLKDYLDLGPKERFIADLKMMETRVSFWRGDVEPILEALESAIAATKEHREPRDEELDEWAQDRADDWDHEDRKERGVL